MKRIYVKLYFFTLLTLCFKTSKCACDCCCCKKKQNTNSSNEIQLSNTNIDTKFNLINKNTTETNKNKNITETNTEIDTETNKNKNTTETNKTKNITETNTEIDTETNKNENITETNKNENITETNKTKNITETNTEIDTETNKNKNINLGNNNKLNNKININENINSEDKNKININENINSEDKNKINISKKPINYKTNPNDLKNNHTNVDINMYNNTSDKNNNTSDKNNNTNNNSNNKSKQITNEYNNVNITEYELQDALKDKEHKYLNKGGGNTIGIIKIKDKKCCYSYKEDNSLKKRFNFNYIVKNTLYKFFFQYDQPIIYNRYLQDFVEGECINSPHTILTFYKNYKKDEMTERIKDFTKYLEFFENILKNQNIDLSSIKDIRGGTKCYKCYSEEIEKRKDDKTELKKFAEEKKNNWEKKLKRAENFLKIRNLIDEMGKLVFNKDVVRLSLLNTGDDFMRNQIFKYNVDKTACIQVIPIDLDFYPRTYIDDSIEKYCVNNQNDIEIAIKEVFGDKDLNELTKLIDEDIRRVYNENNIKEGDEDYKFLATLDDEIEKYTKKYINLVADNLSKGSKYLCKCEENKDKFLFNESTRNFLESKSKEFKEFSDNLK